MIVDGYEASNSRDQDSDSGESSYEEVEVEVEVDATVDETLGRSAMIGDSFKNSLNGGDNRSQMTPDNGDRLRARREISIIDRTRRRRMARPKLQAGETNSCGREGGREGGRAG